MKTIGTFLIAVALVAGMVGCGDGVDNGNGNGLVRYELTVYSTSGGSVLEPGEGVHIYEEGTVVDLVAEPDAGYRFVNWTGDVTTVANVEAATTTVIVNGDYAVTANFEEIPAIQYELTISSSSGGSVTTPGEGIFTYDDGMAVNLVASPASGYRFVNWTGDVDTIADVEAASTAITMEDNYAITASFLEADLYLDEIGPGVWHLSVRGEGVEASVTEEGLVVNVAADPVDDEGMFGTFARTQYSLEGDFDLRVDYRLMTWPKGSGVRVGLVVVVPPERGLNVERVSWGPAESSDPPFREVYLVSYESMVDDVFTDTDDIAGTLRTRREGAIVSCYHSTSEGWHQIWTTEWFAEDVEIIIGVWSHEYLFGGEEVSVLLRAVEIVEPGAQS